MSKEAFLQMSTSNVVKSLGGRAPPQTPLGELITALPHSQTPNWWGGCWLSPPEVPHCGHG